MKAVIRLDVPEWQIGQETTVYFPDTMMKHGICQKDEIVRCKDCKRKYYELQDGRIVCTHIDSNGNDEHGGDWFCADGEREYDG